MQNALLTVKLILVLLLLSACSPAKKQSPADEITVQLKWLHQAQFAGFYVAQEKGYYRDENLKVNFLEGGEGVNITATLRSGKADFGVISSEIVLTDHKHSAPITAIAAIYRRSAVVYVTKKESDITKPEDFLGKSIAAKIETSADSAMEFEYQLKALLTNLALDINQVDVVPYDPQYKDFLDDTVPITAAYYTAGVIKLRNKGIDLNIIWPGDYGVQLYSDTLVTNSELVKNNPQLVERFLRATLKGWSEALGNAEEAAEITLKYAKVKDLSYQLEMLNKLRPLVDTGEDYIGWMNKKTWQNLHDLLLEQRILTGPIVHLEDLYTVEFLHSIYGQSK